MDAVRLLEPEEEVEFRVEAGDAGRRLDAVLAARLAWASRASVVRWIREGRASVDGAPAERASRVVAAGQLVRIRVRKTRRDLDQPWGDLLPLEVVQRGDGWVVVEKPADVPSHPGGGVIKRTLLTAAAVELHAEAESSGPWLPHRLDRETSGLSVVALRRDALRRFAAAFRAGRIRRVYRAVLRGRLDATPDWVDLRFPLVEVGQRPKRIAVDPGGSPAHTRLRVLHADAAASEVELEPVTGRQHQLRVHAAHIGHPIVGDPRYDPRAREGERMRLHASRLEIPADVAGERAAIVVESRRSLEGARP